MNDHTIPNIYSGKALCWLWRPEQYGSPHGNVTHDYNNRHNH